MKKYLYILLIALGAIAVSCQKEQDQKEPQGPGTVSTTAIKLVGSADTSVKALIEDAAGAIWEAGDPVRFLYFHAGDADAYWSTDYELTASDIEDGNKATYRGNLDPAVLLGVFRYNHSGNTEFYFTETDKISKDIYTFTQAEAGKMDKSQLHLHSGLTPVTIDNSADADEQVVAMDIVGTVMRLLPYTETYGAESIQSVSFTSSGFITGVVRYHYGTPSYDSVEDVNWAKAKGVQVNLGTPCSLSKMTSREASKGIYFSLPATETGVSTIPDYEIVVTTDAAKYHFVSTAALELGENKVRNIFLKLENGEREDLTAIKGLYWFDGNLAGGYTGSALDYGKEAQDIADLGYWVVYSQDSAEGSPVVAREPADYPDFYDNTVISIVDNATNAAPDWLQFGYSANHANSHLWIKLTENTADAARQAVITFTYPDAAHQYQLRANEPKKVITVTQEGAVAEEKPLFKYTFSGSGWNQGWAASGRSLSYTADGYTRQASDDWLAPHGIVIAPDLQKLNGENAYVAYTPGAAFPSEDVAPFVKQALGLTDEAYAAASWITFGVHVEGAQWLIRIDGVAANTGEARSLSGNILNPDGSTYSTYSISQAAGGGSQGGGDFTMPTARESFLAIPGGTLALTITKNSDTEITITGVPADAAGNPMFVLYNPLPDGVTVSAVTSSDISHVERVNEFQAGFWIPSNDSTSERTMVGTVTFTDGSGTQDMKVNIVQAGVDKTDAVELWTAASHTLVKTYCGWTNVTSTTSDAITIGTNTISVAIPSDKSIWWEWGYQFFVATDIVPQSGKSYDFSCKLTSSHTAESSCTMKLATWNGSGDEGEYFFKGGENLLTWQAGETKTVSVEGMAYNPAFGTNPLVLILDFGYNAAGITINVSDISLREY